MCITSEWRGCSRGETGANPGKKDISRARARDISGFKIRIHLPPGAFPREFLNKKRGALFPSSVAFISPSTLASASPVRALTRSLTSQAREPRQKGKRKYEKARTGHKGDSASRAQIFDEVARRTESTSSGSCAECGGNNDGTRGKVVREPLARAFFDSRLSYRLGATFKVGLR